MMIKYSAFFMVFVQVRKRYNRILNSILSFFTDAQNYKNHLSNNKYLSLEL